MDRQALIGLNHFVNKDNIIVIQSPTYQKANETVLEILEKYSDFKTAMFLSGGSTPRKLYELIASKKTLKVGAVGQIDERFGKENHRNSNELMIANTGLTEYLESMNIRFYPMLENSKDIEVATGDYDEALRFILKYFPKSVGVLGIGSDGHTAGIPTNSEIVNRFNEDQSSLVKYYDIEKYGPRITLSFLGLAQLDLIIILVLGQEKREILTQMFKEGSEEELPARFYKREEIAGKVILVTDQMI